MLKPALLYTIRVLFIALFSAHAAYGQAGDDAAMRYLWGRGLSIPALNLNLGGYTEAAVKAPERGDSELVLEDLSLFVSWTPLSQLRFFAEIELEDWLSTRRVRSLEAALSPERYYFDWLITPAFTMRLGKYLTPVGRWNVIHAAPLVWTTNRPLVTKNELFNTHGTGVMGHYSRLLNDRNLELTVYLDDSEHLEPRKRQPHFEQAAGLRLNYEWLDNLEIGASYLAYRNRTQGVDNDQHIFGVDMSWRRRDYEVMAEWLYRKGDKAGDYETGLYAQGVAPLGHKIYAVGRYEYLNGRHVQDQAAFDLDTHIGVLGLAWRPYTPLVLKTEYRFGDGNESVAPSGFFASFAMFF